MELNLEKVVLEVLSIEATLFILICNKIILLKIFLSLITFIFMECIYNYPELSKEDINFIVNKINL